MRWIVFSVKGIVLSAGNEVLLLKRAPQNRYCPEHWDLPGGKIETLNFKIDFIREAREEAGLSVDEVILRGALLKKSALYRTVFGWPAWHCTLFVSAIGAMREITLSDEHIGFGWFKLPHAKSLFLTPETRCALERYAR